MGSDTPPDNNNEDTFDEKQEPQIPRRGRTPSIIVQSLNLNAQGGTSITESIELNGEEDFSPEDSNSSSTSPVRRSIGTIHDTTTGTTTSSSSSNDIKGSNINSNIDKLSQQLQNYTTNETIQAEDTSSNSVQGSSTSLFNATSTSPLRNMRSPDPRPPASVVGNRRLSLNIGTTAPRRLSLNVDSLPSFATAASLSPSSTTTNSFSTDTSQSPTKLAGGNATGSLRNKVALKPGHSLMGWIAYTSTAKNLSGTNGKFIDVTPEELAKHDKKEDCWVALKENVYNVTSYLQYHPGGEEELMKGAGKDATELFNEVHMWVNFESILAKCLVGPYKIST